uniref:Uncharacterized protein n=1 Tax=Arundo donax TaxID=35708 RepID=A0A0A9DH63_ARUDO
MTHYMLIHAIQPQNEPATRFRSYKLLVRYINSLPNGLLKYLLLHMNSGGEHADYFVGGIVSNNIHQSVVRLANGCSSK